MSNVLKEYGFIAYTSIILLILMVITPTIHIHADWAYGYYSISEMYEESDLIIRGVIRRSSQRFGLDTISPGNLETMHEIGVKIVIKGGYSGISVFLSQMGGRYMLFKVLELDDYPLFKIGDEVILFLKKGRDYDYRSIGGPQGSYKVINGKVYSILESVNKDKFWSPNIRGNGTDVDLFTNLL